MFFTKNQIAVLVRMQDQLNSKINPNWALSTDQDFLLAAGMEAAEAIDHLGWKWWKSQVPNIAQVEMELVDILHFIISDLIRGVCTENLNLPPNTSCNKSLDLLQELAAICFDNSSFEDPIQKLYECFIHFDMSPDKVFSMYVGKNVLNTFRQNNGYKEGTYIKVWSGLEDNEHLTQILKTIDINSLTVDEDLYRALTAAYEVYA